MNKSIFLLGFLIFIIMLVPSQIRNLITQYFVQISQTLFSWNVNGTLSHGWIAKISPFKVTISMFGHFILFLLLTFWIASVKKGMTLVTLMALIGFSALTEGLQVLSINRNASLVDFGINLFAIFVASLFVILIKRFFSCKQEVIEQ